jgi:hypothetical protein
LTSRDFILHPFPGSLCLPALLVAGHIARQGSRLNLTYTLSGQLQEVIIPAPAQPPTRRWLLWESTCLEFFLKIPGDSGYWEANLSPSGDWNFFRLSGYRQGIAEEPAIAHLPVSSHRQPDRFVLQTDLELAALLPAHEPWHLALSAVLEHPGGRFTFWALSHPAPQPDFHHSDSFILLLAP